MAASLFGMSIASNNGEYVSYVNDLVRMAVIHTSAQTLWHLQFGEAFTLTPVLNILIGVSVYWLVVRRLIAIR